MTTMEHRNLQVTERPSQNWKPKGHAPASFGRKKSFGGGFQRKRAER